MALIRISLYHPSHGMVYAVIDGAHYDEQLRAYSIFHYYRKNDPRLLSEQLLQRNASRVLAKTNVFVTRGRVVYIPPVHQKTKKPVLLASACASITVHTTTVASFQAVARIETHRKTTGTKRLRAVKSTAAGAAVAETTLPNDQTNSFYELSSVVRDANNKTATVVFVGDDQYTEAGWPMERLARHREADVETVYVGDVYEIREKVNAVSVGWFEAECVKVTAKTACFRWTRFKGYADGKIPLAALADRVRRPRLAAALKRRRDKRMSTR